MVRGRGAGGGCADAAALGGGDVVARGGVGTAAGDARAGDERARARRGASGGPRRERRGAEISAEPTTAPSAIAGGAVRGRGEGVTVSRKDRARDYDVSGCESPSGEQHAGARARVPELHGALPPCRSALQRRPRRSRAAALAAAALARSRRSRRLSLHVRASPRRTSPRRVGAGPSRRPRLGRRSSTPRGRRRPPPPPPPRLLRVFSRLHPLGRRRRRPVAPAPRIARDGHRARGARGAARRRGVPRGPARERAHLLHRRARRPRQIHARGSPHGARRRGPAARGPRAVPRPAPGRAPARHHRQGAERLPALRRRPRGRRGNPRPRREPR